MNIYKNLAFNAYFFKVIFSCSNWLIRLQRDSGKSKKAASVRAAFYFGFKNKLFQYQLA